MRVQLSPDVSAHELEQRNLRHEPGSVNYATVLPKKSYVPDTQVVVSHEEDLTTVPEAVIYSYSRAAFKIEPSDAFDGQSVDPSDCMPTYEHYC